MATINYSKYIVRKSFVAEKFYGRFLFQTGFSEHELSVLFTKGARIWMPDSTEVWRAAELLEDFKAIPCKLKILYEEAEDSAFRTNYSLLQTNLYKKPDRESVLEIKDKKKLPHLRNPEILIGENDLTSLSYLNEPEVLYNLKIRFVERNIIYTYCGIVLVAINPYETLDIYGNEIIQAYSGQDMGAMDPHIYAVAEEAFKRMTRFEQDQSIIVSGESGAGKTVSAKYAMRYFAMVGGSQTETQVEKKVLASNPIMEAIGNAKTTRNDNSSRFGKYLEISFNKKNEIIGANMRTYLLEKSRVVFQAKDERNYHVFYQMCASRNLPELKKFQLGDPEDFNYTNQGENSVIDGVDDAEEFQNLREAMRLLGLQEKDQMMIFQILSALLHFGNVLIKEKDAESSDIPSKDKNLTTACKLLGIEESQMRMWLCNRKITTVGETLMKPLTASQATFSQDALSKCIYSKVFDWIVTQVNKVLHSQTKQNRFIGVLDIYGFETFEVNSFEQFCINYANEKLQQIFNMHVFKLEQEEYVKEEIEWSFIDFYDNQPCIDLIEAKLGILDLLDEECKLPKGSDGNWCQKLYGKHSKAEHFDKPRMSNMAFSIYHFADKVTYTANGFLEKNRDTVFEEQINILRASEYELVAELFTEHKSEKDQKKPGGRVKALQTAPQGSNKQMKKTVGSQFRDSLYLLMETLNSTSPHYIRCIKPNDDKEAFEFEPKRVVEQLRACGVLETIRISAAGFPSRWTYPEFFQRYRVLAISKDINRKNHRKTCENVLTKLIQDPDKYRFGKTKIFFRAGQVAYLEKLRADKLRACGVMIQKHVRGWLVHKQYQKLRRTALAIQRYGRGLLARRHYQYLREMRAATIIQKHWRGYNTRKTFHNVQRAVVKIQSVIRGYFGRREFQRRLYEHKTKIIQCHVRTFLARRRFQKVKFGIVKVQGHFRRRKAKAELKQLKIEAKSVEHIKNVNKGLENKIIQLQQKLDTKVKEVKDYHEQENHLRSLQDEVQKLRGNKDVAEKASNRVTELEEELRRLRIELEKERGEKQDVISEKELMRKKYEQELQTSNTEKIKLKEELDAANKRLQEQAKSNEVKENKELEIAYQQLQAEIESERQHHQRLVKEHNRLLQRFENMQGEMQVLTSPLGHKRTPSDISMISLESVTSSVSPEEKKDGEEGEKEDQGYGTEKKKRPAPAPPSALSIEKAITESTVAKETEKQQQQPPVQAVSDIDVGLLLKLQNKVKILERERDLLRQKLEDLEEETPSKTKSPGITNDSAFESLKMQELENENDKLKREVSKLMTSIASNTNFEPKGRKISPAGKEFLGTLNRKLIKPGDPKRRSFIGRAMSPLRRSLSVREVHETSNSKNNKKLTRPLGRNNGKTLSRSKSMMITHKQKNDGDDDDDVENDDDNDDLKSGDRKRRSFIGRLRSPLRRSSSVREVNETRNSKYNKSLTRPHSTAKGKKLSRSVSMMITHKEKNENDDNDDEDRDDDTCCDNIHVDKINLDKSWVSTPAITELKEKKKSFFRRTFLSEKKQKSPKKKITIDQFEAMSDELERRREECLQLRALLAEKSISTHSIAKQSYGGEDDLVNEDNELTMAYKSQRDIIRLLEDQLQKAEKDLKKRETDYTKEIQELQKENEKQQKIITQSLSLTPEAKIEATMQHEITRLTAENLDLREIIDKKDAEIRKLKKMIKHYAKRLKEGEAAEIQAELEKEEAKSVENVATIKHRERNYMGMLEYKKENETALIKTLITDLRPKVAAGLLPGLPAYILFMCVRHTDYINDDEKVRSLLTSTINGIKKAVKKHHDDLDRVTLWLANTCRFLHTLKQYSGEKAFNQENTPRQNEHCLRNFDLAEYRQVFSDLAVWIYQTLIKLMEATIQPSIVAAVLEHEAIAGLSGSKPSGLRGRTSSRTEDSPEYSLDSLMKALNQFVRTLSQHAVDPELVKQIFRQLYYFIGASALNNLLLRKDMCNWSKGMQIRYNLSHLEQWLRDSKLQESGAGTSLEPIVQASQLLQARKTEADVESVCDMCSKLSIPQIVKILNLYTPVDEFEERVPISFIRKLQQHLKNRPNQDSHLLMDLKFSFSVTFPFNPSNISLETIDIPDSLPLTGITKL